MMPYCPDEERVALTGMLAEFRDALEEEMDHVQKNGLSSMQLFGGKPMGRRGTDLWYRFQVQYAPSLPADTPCKLVIGQEQFEATVISFEENAIVVSTKKPLPDTIGKARLENGSAVLMEQLIKRIEANAQKENPAGRRMIPSDGSVYTAQKVFDYRDLTRHPGNTPSQNNAIQSALSYDITYIWGPPGTGKTTVIGQIIDELYQHDRSVCVVAHTNTAVDGAMEKADKTYAQSNPDDDANYPILRIGTPTRPLPDRVLLAHHVAALGKELCEQKAALEKRQVALQRRIEAIQTMLAKDNWLKEGNLERIRKALHEITLLEKEIAEIQRRMDAINATAAQEKAAHPEYATYLNLSKSLNAKRKDYEIACAQVDRVEKAMAELPKSIQAAQDEIRKHARYTLLRAQEAELMSAPFLRTEMGKADAQIARLQNTIHDLTVQQTAAQQTIADYEKKGSIARLFTNKSHIAQARMTLERVRGELPVANGDLHRQQELKQAYAQQLESLLLLQEQIRAVTPSQTPEYWHQQEDRLQAELSDAKKALPGLSAGKNALHQAICELECQQQQAKASYDTLSELGRKNRREQDKMAEVRRRRDEENAACSAQLKKEIAMCTAFLYTPVSVGATPLLEELSGLFAAVKVEMASVDVDAIMKEKEDADQQLCEVCRQLNELRAKMQELEKQAIMNAKIVGATLVQSYLNETLRERKFDTVIVDEASMASIPALWCAGYLAQSSMVIVGDFLQLPPIVMADTPMARKWLGKDIFYHSGMQEKARSRASCPANFVMLNHQFRMEADIADIANMYYGEYGGLLSDDNSEFRVQAREKFYSWYSGKRTRRNVHLIDTGSLHAWVTGVPQGKGQSRLNCFSAAVSVDLAFKFLENRLKDLDPETAQPEKEASVLIVAPYKPHIARVNQLVELEYHNRGFRENLNFIRAGTIHSFQGNEADIVIFDLVIDEPHWKANLFMPQKEVNDDLRKMFNVAVTRARFKLFLVGHFAYCQKRAKNNALSELLDKLIDKDKLERIDAKALFPNIVWTRQSDFAFDGNLQGKHIVCREESFNDCFMADIKSFQKRMIIYSAFMTEARLSTLLPAFADAVREGKQIIVVTKALFERGNAERARYQRCEEEMRAIGVHILHKQGMHEKLIFVDSDAVWIGSLNALSFTGLTGEVMQRHADRELTREYEKLFDIEHICGAIEHAYEQKCPVCGKEMLVKESDKGGIYWQCVAGDYARNTAQQYPRDGILRCKCGAAYVFAMKNEPRWVCAADSRHYQKMRESDLKLGKMAALIPTEADRIKVKQYFLAKKNARKDKIKPLPR